ncbi:MAG TPA: hypothetical protein VI756_05955 [Blastocatellia bacterium]
MNKFRSIDLRNAVGYLGVAVVFLSTVGYSLHVTFNSSVADKLLAVTFCATNVVAWIGGAYAFRRESTRAFGTTMLVLGDTIFPLNLYAPAYLYFPPLKGNAAMTASVVLMIGIVYHLRGFKRAPGRRFAPAFYPYFFAGSVGATLYLTRFTLGLSAATATWAVVVFAVVFQIGATYLAAGPRREFSLATLALLAGTLFVGLGSFRSTKSTAHLLEFFTISVVLWWLAATSRKIGPAARLFGLGFYVVLTTALTAALYYFGAHSYLYVIVTTLWIAVLSAFRAMLRGGRTYAFREPADWLSMILGLGLIAHWGPFWSALLRNVIVTPLGHALSLPASLGVSSTPSILVPFSLVGISGSFLWSSYHKRRYPVISASKAGFIINTGLIWIASYLPLLLIVAASAALGLALSGQMLAAPVASLAVGVVYLAASEGSNELYPMRTLEAAGYIAIGLAVLASIYNVTVASSMLLACSLVFLWRSTLKRSYWLQLCFLVLASAGAALAGIREPGRDQIYILSLLSVGLVGVYRWLRSGPSRYYEAQLTLVWACVLALATIVTETVWGAFSPFTFLPIWAGFLILIGGDRAAGPGKQDRPDTDRNVFARFRSLASAGYWVGHLAAAALILSVVVKSGRSLAAAAFALSFWSIGQFCWCNLARGRAGERLSVVAARRSLISLALISLLLAALAPDRRFMATGDALAVSTLFVLMRVRWKSSIFEDAAAIALIEASFLFGAKIGITNADYYLSAAGLYLCFITWRSYRKVVSAPRSTRLIPRPRGRAMRLWRFLLDNPAAVAVIAIAVLYPFWRYVRTLDNTHLYYLGAGTVVLIYLFLWTHRHASLVYMAGAMFVPAAVVFIVFGHAAQGMNLFLVLVGASIIVSQLYPVKVGIQPNPRGIKPGQAAMAAGD